MKHPFFILMGVWMALNLTPGLCSIEVAGQDAKLQFSYIGYLTKKVPVSGKTVIDVQLPPDIKKPDEMVFIGYGTQKKADAASSVATVKSDNL
jgi:hypothetical protein